MKKMNKKGFTIVELVIVIAVIAILSAVLIPTFSGVVADANKTAVVADAKAKYQEYMTANITNYEKDVVYVDADKKMVVIIKDSQIVEVTVEDKKTSAVEIASATVAEYEKAAKLAYATDWTVDVAENPLTGFTNLYAITATAPAAAG